MKRTDNEIESKRIFMDLDVIRKCNDCPYIVKCYGYIITFVRILITFVSRMYLYFLITLTSSFSVTILRIINYFQRFPGIPVPVYGGDVDLP